MDAEKDEGESGEMDAIGAEDAGPTEPSKVSMCVGCGNVFVEDAVFCRKCGLRRGFREDDDDMQEEGATQKVAVSSAFIASKKKMRYSRRDNLTLSKRIMFDVYEFLDSSVADASLALVVMIDFLMICIDIDNRAVKAETPQYVEIVSSICLAVYAGEFITKFAFHRCAMFRSKLEILDLAVLLAGFAELILLACGVPVNEIGLLRMLRVGRMIRLIRVVKGIHYLKELRKLIFMFGSCVKTLFWSFVFCFCVMTIWSMMAVQLIDPIVQRLADETHVFDNCEDCRRSFSNVLRANLTMFKTVVAGDSWGQVAIPVIEEEPLAAIIFIGSLMSLLYGLLQLVVAVVVDSAAELRQNDVLTLAMDLDHEQTQDMESLRNIFKNMDGDNDGELDLDELMMGAESSPEFQSRLRVMDIDKADLVQLFEMLDADSDGTISPDEFTFALSRWTHDSKTASRFIKYIVTQMMVEQRSLRSLVIDLGKRMDRERTGARKTRNEGGAVGSVKRQETKTDVLNTDVSNVTLQEVSPLSPSSRENTPAVTENLLHIPDVAIREHRQAAAALAIAIQSSVKALHDSTLAAMEQAKTDLHAAATSLSIPQEVPAKTAPDEHAKGERKSRSGNSLGTDTSADGLAESLASTPGIAKDLRVLV